MSNPEMYRLLQLVSQGKFKGVLEEKKTYSWKIVEFGSIH